MRKFTSFKDFALANGSLTEEGQVDQNKINIAKQALLIDTLAGAPAAGSMSKEDAVKVLRSAGISDEQIRRLIITGGVILPQEIERLMK
jgi:hypothetical protein